MGKKKKHPKAKSVTIEARKKVTIIEDPSLEENTLHAHPSVYEDIVKLIRNSLGQYLSFYEEES